MEQETKNVICLLLNVLILPGLGTIIHGESKRGLIQLVVFIVGIPLVSGLIVFLTWVESSESASLIGFLILIAIWLLIVFLVLVWIWALLDGISFVQNKEFYVFKDLK